MWITSMGNHGAVSQNAGVLVVLVLPPLISNQLKSSLILNWSAKMQYWYLCTSIIISIASSVDLLHLFEITFGYIQVQFCNCHTHIHTSHTPFLCAMASNFFHTQLWFPASDHDFQWFESDFRCFREVITGKKHCGRNIIDHGHPWGTDFTPCEFVFHRNPSWFLEYIDQTSGNPPVLGPQPVKQWKTDENPYGAGLPVRKKNCCRKPLYTVWYKTKFGSQNFGYQLWCLFCNICNVFKNMFNVELIIMWLSIVVVGFSTTEIWALENLEGYQLW